MKANNEKNINSIYNHYYKEVYKFILFRINGKHEIAEELTQDVFIKANEHLANYNVKLAKMKTWLFTIANNKVIDYYRSNAKNTKVNVSDFSDAETGKEVFQFIGSESTETRVENTELRIKIVKAIESLKPDYRRMAELFFYDDKQYQEIADICKVPLGTVKGMINRCRVKLQEVLQNEYVNL
jgi:RNA polymerase sigma-70 factor (ECF subfamily)